MTTRIRAGAGLGDSLYLRPIVDHFVRSGQVLRVLSDYPHVFVGCSAEVDKFERTRAGIVAHYAGGKSNLATTQFEDMLTSAGIKVQVPLRFPWTVRNHALIDGLLAKAAGRPLIIVHGGRAPMGRIDGYGLELLPERAAFDAALGALSDCMLIQVGKATQLYPLRADLDLNRSTTVSDLLDIATVCAGVVGQCSFAVPLAECFGKPLLVVWAARGLASKTPFISQITPRKIFQATTSRFVIDDWPLYEIEESARAFRFVE